MHRTLSNLIKAFGVLAALLLAPLAWAAPTIVSRSHTNFFNVNYGSSLTMSVVASGTGSLTYQWYLGGLPISGATSASYAIPYADDNTWGNYYVSVTDSTGSVESGAFIPTVQNIPALAFVSQPSPTSQTVAAGGSVTYHFTMSGGMGALTSEKVYVSSSGAVVNAFLVTLTRGSNGLHTGTIRMTSVEASQGGTFYLRMVSSLYGTATSSPFSLTVDTSNLAPVITAQPVSRTIVAGNSAELSVTATGSGLSYQWKKDGVNATGLTATSPSYFVSVFNASHIGSYSVTVSNSYGSVASDAATLGMALPVFQTHPTDKAAIPENTTSFSVAVTNPGSHTTYQWNKDGVAIAGATQTTYSFTVTANSGGVYTCTATNGGGSVTSNPATLTINLPIPVITTQPVNRTVNLGASTSFSVNATTAFRGNGWDIQYQWKKNGVNIGVPQTTPFGLSTFTIPSAASSDAGTYSVVLSNSYGSVTSAEVTLTVTQTFADWAAAAALPVGQNGQTDDPDRDGASNLLEYALGLNPTSPSASVLPAAVVESGQVVVRFTRARTATGVTLQSFVSPDMVNWTPGPAPVVESSTTSTDTCTVTLPAGQSRYFLRLEATSP